MKRSATAPVTPPLHSIRPTTPGEHAELDVLRQLAEGLPAQYELFHSIDWTLAEPQGDRHGELDIVVLNEAGDVALLEVKAGEVQFSPGGLTKQYGGADKDIGRQAAWQFSSLLHRFKSEGMDVRLCHFLVLPHQRVPEAGVVSYPRERIADAQDCLDLPGYIQRKLGSGRPGEMRERVSAFMHNRLALQPDLSALSGSLQRRVSAISGGLATWVSRIHAPSGVIRVQGTAGSGKTQLALRLLREACVRRQAAAYVCFNRPLADQMRQFAPDQAQTGTFHQLCWDAAGRPGPDVPFDTQADRYMQAMTQAAPDLDLLVIDEMQDFHAEWLEALISRLRPAGRLYLLDDPSQCLYPDRAEIDIADAVRVTAHENYRSPRKLVQTLNLLRLSATPLQACSPFEGEPPEFRSYAPDANDNSHRSLLRQTLQAVQACLQRGFALQDIVVLCWRGRETSRLAGLAQLGDWRVTRFTGTYDASGEPHWSDGALRIETVRRFKGQSAQAVVLTEVDFTDLTPLHRNLLFVGLTRAQMHVEWVLSDRAQAALVRHSQLG